MPILIKETDSKEKEMSYRLVSGLGLYLFFSSLVITGIYNLDTVLPFILGLMLGIVALTSKNLINTSE